MKILSVTGTYTPSINGIAISLDIQKKALEKRGHKVTVIAPDHPKKVDEENVIRFPSVNIGKFPDYPIFLPVPKISDLPRLSDSYDLVYFHHPFWVGDLSLNLAKLYRCPSVFFYHTQYEQYAKTYFDGMIPGNLVSKLVAGSVRRTIQKSSHVIVETNTFQKKLSRLDTPTPISVITSVRQMEAPNTSKVVLRTKYGLNHHDVIALYVGRVSPEKNLRNLLKIFSQIKTSRPFTLCLAGDGPELESLRALAIDLNISDHCRFLGQVEFSKIPEVYKMADLFVFPSKSDTQAAVVLEALSFGLPVIGFNAPGPKDFVQTGHNGFLAGNIRNFTDFTQTLIDRTDLRKNLSVKAKDLASKYSFNDSIGATEKLFYSLTEK